MSNITIRVKQENINEAKVTFECKLKDAFKIIQSIAREHSVNILMDAEGMSVVSAVALLEKMQSIFIEQRKVGTTS